MIRKAKAVWRGTGRAGSGHLSTDSGVLAQTPYSFKTRFENEKGTNPRSLLPPHTPAVSPWHLPFSCRAAATLPRSSAPRRPSRWTRKARAFASPARL